MPYYTEPSKLAALKPEMTISAINTTLGVEPYDVYHLQDDGSSVLVYMYRIKKRRVSYTSPEDLNSATSQTTGTPWYDEEHKAYILLNNGKLASLITDNGRAESKLLLVTNNLLQLIGKKDLVGLEDYRTLYDESNQANKPENGSNNAIVIPLDKVNVNAIDGVQLNLK